MVRIQTLVQLNDELVAALDRRAAAQGTSRSHLVREAIESYLHDDREAEITRQIIEAYERVPQSTPDEWGDPMAHLDAAAIETFRRLDAEERAAGMEPW